MKSNSLTKFWKTQCSSHLLFASAPGCCKFMPCFLYRTQTSHFSRFGQTRIFLISGTAGGSSSNSSSAYCNACPGENSPHGLWTFQWDLHHWPNSGNITWFSVLTSALKSQAPLVVTPVLLQTLTFFPWTAQILSLRARRGSHKLPRIAIGLLSEYYTNVIGIAFEMLLDRSCLAFRYGNATKLCLLVLN